MKLKVILVNCWNSGFLNDVLYFLDQYENIILSEQKLDLGNILATVGKRQTKVRGTMDAL